MPTIAYLPYCFFNLASPIISLVYGFTGFRIERIEPTGDPPPATAGGIPTAGDPQP